MLELFSSGFAAILSSPVNLLLILGAVVVGIVFGALPGLSSSVAVAMFLPLTFGMDLALAIAVLTSLYIGGTSGGLVASILLNIPGAPSAMATTFDGHPMALNGQAGKALGVGIFCSFIGTVLGIAALIFLAPTLAAVTIKFGPWEYFSVTLLSMGLISALVGKSLTKGLIAAVLGLMIGTVGMDPIDAARRFTFGNIQLTSGFILISVLVGIYAIPEVLSATSPGKEKKASMITDFKIRGFGFSFAEMAGQIPNIIRSFLIGLGVGILPGIGGATSNIISYSVAKNTSKYPEKFGTGIIDGVVAPETTNNATIGGAMITLLTLGIPGDGVTALILAGFMIHGVTPGPLLFTTHSHAVYMVFASMLLASFLMLGSMYFGIRGFVRMFKIPVYVLMPVIVVLCILGAYSADYRLFDAWALVCFGVLGMLLKKFDIPAPPLVLGFILGPPIETNLRRGLQYSRNDLTDLVNYPIALFFFAALILFFVFSGVKRLRSKKA